MTTKQKEEVVSAGGISALHVRKELAKRFQEASGLEIREMIERLKKAKDPNTVQFPVGPDLGSYISGAMVVLGEVFPHPGSPTLMSPAVPKLWLLGDRRRILESMLADLEG